MPKFSSRFGFDPRVPRETILEDAPQTLRIAFLNSVLEPSIRDARDNEDNRPLTAFGLSKQFCGLAREEVPDFPHNTTAWEDLKSLIKGGQWFNFYDFVERVGKNLIIQQNDFRSEAWVSEYGFSSYRDKVNELFSEDRVGWRLDESSELVREIPKSLAAKLAATSARLRDDFEPAREHYLKAVRYVSTRPLDAENAIKEITSAVESVGRVFYPSAKTLGDVAKELKRQDSWPPTLVAMIEKFYGFASSEPGVRHGAPVSSRVALADAEFCLHVGVALIRYIMEKHESQGKNPTAAA